MWPISLLKSLDRSIRNFIWSGNASQRKLVTVSWQKMCSPSSAGGVGLRSLRSINEAALLKLAWNVLSSQGHWSLLLRSRFLRYNKPIGHYAKSSIWPGVRQFINTAVLGSCWQIGNGNKVNLWRDYWLPYSISEELNIPDHVLKYLKADVKDFIHNKSWFIPRALETLFPDIARDIQQIIIPVEAAEDQLIWKDSSDGSLSFKDAFLYLNPAGNTVSYGKKLWSTSIPPSRSFLVWRLIHNKVPTDDKLIAKGCTVVSVCSLCYKAFEILIISSCSVSMQLLFGIG